MSNSALAKKYIPSPSTNHWGTRKEKIKKIIIHHAAAVGSAERLARLFASES
ncbi:MAG: lysozyme, partial [Ruminococcaceae bacterium]|nr:lysozyme [Oscillospiraceae bacterium]